MMYKKATLLFSLATFTIGCTPMKDLPDYVVINNPKSSDTAVLRKPAQPFTFPLSEEDKELVQILIDKFDQEENCAGLAAPQIGISKRVIVFEVKDEEDLKKWRPDLNQTMPKTVWLNPSYEPVGEEKTADYEGCFSVDDLAGPVARYTTVRYMAFTPQGKKVEGTAHGFLARVIQHEVDHINGRCFVDLVPESELFSIEEYRKKRQNAMKSD